MRPIVSLFIKILILFTVKVHNIIKEGRLIVKVFMELHICGRVKYGKMKIMEVP
jgi:hypothetical protein